MIYQFTHRKQYQDSLIHVRNPSNESIYALHQAMPFNFLKPWRKAMQNNSVPKYDMSDNPTNCCPRFNPDNWDNQELHFRDKLFVRVKSRSIFHIPINISSVFSKTFSAIEKASAQCDNDMIVLSIDPSPWTTEHFISVNKDVPGQEMVQMTGDYLTKVFEGPYKNAPKWIKQMEQLVKDTGKQAKQTYLYYTTCPKCAKFYGKNYIVAVSEFNSQGNVSQSIDNLQMQA